MDDFHFIFFPLLIIVALLSFLIRKKLRHLLFEREGDFCKLISLTGGVATDSPAASWKLIMLIAFNTNKNYLSDGEVLALLKKARIIDLSYYTVFIVYLVFIVRSFAL